MYHLIKLDLLVQKRQLFIFIPIILLFILMDKHPALIFLVASMIIPFNALTYDDKAETNILLNSLPYTRAEIIASRYLGGLIYMLVAIGVTSAALILLNRPFSIEDVAIGSGIFLLFAAFAFPLFYVFKSGYISTVVFICFLLMVLFGPSALSLVAEHLTAITDFMNRFSPPALYAGAAVVIMTLYALSWKVTTILYQRRAF